MGQVFFIDWELWQQMSFCLACLICVVVAIGIFRLHYLNWKSKRFVIADEEKMSRLSEVRRTGLRVKRDNDIPFGVRAIESGIQVDGIWISRPTTPATPSDRRFASLSTLVTDEVQGKRKDVESSDKVVDFETPTGYDVVDTATPSGSPRISPNDYYRPRQPSQLRNVGDSDEALRRLEGNGRLLDTHVPHLQQQRRPEPPTRRTTGSSSPELERSQSPASQPRQYSPSMTSSHSNARTPDPFSSGSRTNSLSGYPTLEYTSNAAMPQPDRTFAPGQQPRR